AETRGRWSVRQIQLIARRAIAERSLPEAEAGARTFGRGRRGASASTTGGGDGRARRGARLQRRLRGDIGQPSPHFEARFLQTLRRKGGVLPYHLRLRRPPLAARDPRRRRGRGRATRTASA